MLDTDLVPISLPFGPIERLPRLVVRCDIYAFLIEGGFGTILFLRGRKFLFHFQTCWKDGNYELEFVASCRFDSRRITMILICWKLVLPEPLRMGILERRRVAGASMDTWLRWKPRWYPSSSKKTLAWKSSAVCVHFQASTLGFMVENRVSGPLLDRKDSPSLWYNGKPGSGPTSVTTSNSSPTLASESFGLSVSLSFPRPATGCNCFLTHATGAADLNNSSGAFFFLRRRPLRQIPVTWRMP